MKKSGLLQATKDVSDDNVSLHTNKLKEHTVRGIPCLASFITLDTPNSSSGKLQILLAKTWAQGYTLGREDAKAYVVVGSFRKNFSDSKGFAAFVVEDIKSFRKYVHNLATLASIHET